MSNYLYSDAKNVQILIALLKKHNISQIVINSGTTNIALVGSVQYDPFFKVFSCVDERHAGYVACGLAAQSGEPVVLSCTGATASRNYFPALTEAFYRKLPVLAITSMHDFDKVGHLLPQFLDRSVQPKDTVVTSVQCRNVTDEEEAHICELNINKAILALINHGGGPAHINLETGVSTFHTQVLPKVTAIHKYDLTCLDNWPKISQNDKIIVWIGSHKIFTVTQTEMLEKFASTHNVVVLTDNTSGYRGKYALHSSLICSQTGIKDNPAYNHLHPDIVIHIGEISGDYPTDCFLQQIAPVWRINPDGKLRDRLGRLVNIFEMPEEIFFEKYAQNNKEIKNTFFRSWQDADQDIRKRWPDLPFSNPWIAGQLNGKIPEGSVLHFGILNSLRSWNYYQTQRNITTFCNVGGFGIDGILSTLIGASFAQQEKLYFGVLGDLAFFYDLNALGNRHISNNLRILLINNGCGGEFNMYNHPGYQFGKDTNLYIGAGGHFGNKSPDLVKHFAQDLGFTYLTASNKDEFIELMPKFTDSERNKSIILECFINPPEESYALKALNTLVQYSSLKNKIKKIVPASVKNLIKRVDK